MEIILLLSKIKKTFQKYQYERKLFIELVETSESEGLIGLFEGMTSMKKISNEQEVRKVETVAVPAHLLFEFLQPILLLFEFLQPMPPTNPPNLRLPPTNDPNLRVPPVTPPSLRMPPTSIPALRVPLTNQPVLRVPPVKKRFLHLFFL